MKYHFEFFKIYTAFQALVKTSHSTVIKCFRCDLGGEYTSNKFCQLLAIDGTIHQTSCTDTHEKNGVAERKHMHIIETAHSFIVFASVPSEFWGKVVLTTVNLINTILFSHNSSLSPFEKLYKYILDYSFFKVFSCTYFAFHPHVERSKLSSRSTICVFLGYDECKKRYRCFDPITHKLYMSHHVVFLEYIPFFSISSTTHNLTTSDLIRINPFFEDFDSLSSYVPSTSGTPPHVRPIYTHQSTGIDILLSSTPETPFSSTTPQTSYEIMDTPLHQSIRIHKSTKLLDFAYSSSFTSFLAYIHYLSEPSSYKKEIFYPLWQQVIDEELSVLYMTDTWDLVSLPPGKSVVGCCWVYKIKTNFDEFIERYKVRLVAKGYSQQYGMYYKETFAPAANMTIIRTLIIIASIRQ